MPTIEQKREYCRRWHQKNKEKRKIYDAQRSPLYYVKNKEKMLEKRKEYRESEAGKIQRKNSNNKRRALIKETQIEKITIEALKNIYVQQNGLCNICKCNLDWNIKYLVHLDHIIPLSRGGGHVLSNLQYLCKKCNFKKSNTI